jgi:hypothetical protein
MNIEKLIFKRIELWIVLLILLTGTIFTICIIAVSYYLGNNGKRFGIFGNIIEEIANTQIKVASKVIVPDNPLIAKDSISEIALTKTQEGYFILQQDDIQWPHNYTKAQIVHDDWSSLPLMWKSNNATFSYPIVISAQLNDNHEQALLLFNKKREFTAMVAIPPNKYFNRYRALETNLPYIIPDSTDIIIYPQGGDGLFRIDICGNIIWSRPGLYHHHYSTADGVLGILGLPKNEINRDEREKWGNTDVINLIDLENGELLKSFSINDVVRANIDRIDPFLHEQWRDSINPDGVLAEDRVHLNKVEILSKKLADEYPLFPAGSILLSSRSLNLLAIIDPNTLKILWFSSGHTQVQHDPTFIGKNRIMIFNNGYNKNVHSIYDSANFSSLRLYDFTNDTWVEPVNAQKERGFTFHSGNLEFSSKGETIMTLALQGRYIEYDENGKAIFEFINLRDDESVYWTEHAQYITVKQEDQILNRACK